MTPTTERGVCGALIDLATPTGTERVRDFQPPWRTVYRYTCPACGGTVRIRAGTMIGKRPRPGLGAVRCGHPVPPVPPTPEEVSP